MADFDFFVNASSGGGNGTTNAESGANAAYTSPAAAIAARAENLVVSGNNHRFLCSAGSGNNAFSSFTFSSAYVTGPTNRVTWEGYDDPINGDQGPVMPGATTSAPTQGARFVSSLTATTNWACDDRHAYTKWKRLTFFAESRRNGSASSYALRGSFASNWLIEQCLAISQANNAGTFSYNLIGIDPPADSGSVTSHTVAIVRGNVGAGSGTGTNQCFGGGGKQYNLDAIMEGSKEGFHIGFNVNSGAWEYRNCLFDQGGLTGPNIYGWYLAGSATGSNNASTDATAPGTSSRQNQTFTWEGTGDYRLSALDTGALNFGTTIAGIGAYDIFGTLRPQGVAWDIGAHEYISSFIDGEITKAASINIKLLSQITKDASISIKLVSEIIASSSINIYIPTIIDEYIPIEIDFLMEYLMNIDFELEELMNIEFTLSPEDDL